jgi:hypothetical protein
MLSEPPDLDRAALAAALRRRWGVDAARLEYLPVGFGTHHWQAVGADGASWFVSADDLSARQHAGRAPDDVFAGLDRAFRTAAALRADAGLEFVVAPVASSGGAVLCRLDARYAVRVEPFVAGTVEQSGDYERPEDRRRMGALLGRLHAASGFVPVGLPGREDFALPGREELAMALDQLDTPWSGGPFGEPARALVRAHAGSVRERLHAFDRIASRLRDGSTGWIVTHGEPHSANVIRASGSLRLVDWDTTLVAPRERDLWMVLDDDLTGWDEYVAVAGPVALNEDAVGFYKERWALAEVCMYVAEFRRPHEETEDTRAAWEELGEYVVTG